MIRAEKGIHIVKWARIKPIKGQFTQLIFVRLSVDAASAGHLQEQHAT